MQYCKASSFEQLPYCSLLEIPSPLSSLCHPTAWELHKSHILSEGSLLKMVDDSYIVMGFYSEFQVIVTDVASYG